MRKRNIISERKKLGFNTWLLLLLCVFLFFFSFVRLLSQFLMVWEEIGYPSFQQKIGERIFIFLDSGLVLLLATVCIIAGIKLWKLKPHALKDAGWSLLFFLAYHLLFVPIISPLIIKFDPDMTQFYFQETLRQISSHEITGLIGAGMNIFAGIFYIYLYESKKIKATYNSERYYP